MMFINNMSNNTIWQANHCAAYVYRRKSIKYERSAECQSAETRTHRIDGSEAEITAYPTFIMLSAINSSLCIISVMYCRNVIHFYSNTSVFTLKYTKMLFNAKKNLRLKMTAKTQISFAVIRVNDVKMYPSISLAIRFFTASEIACGGWLAFHVCSGAYWIIIFFGNQANGSGLISVGFRVQH